MTIRACRDPFSGDLVLTLDADVTLALHGEIVVLLNGLDALTGERALRVPNTQRLLAILERSLVNSDLTEFNP